MKVTPSAQFFSAYKQSSFLERVIRTIKYETTSFFILRSLIHVKILLAVVTDVSCSANHRDSSKSFFGLFEFTVLGQYIRKLLHG